MSKEQDTAAGPIDAENAAHRHPSPQMSPGQESRYDSLVQYPEQPAQAQGYRSPTDGLRETVEVIRKVVPLRTCADAVFRNRARPCLEYQIKRCLEPCCLPVDRAEYERHLHAATMLLEGKDLELLKEMREQMKAY